VWIRLSPEVDWTYEPLINQMVITLNHERSIIEKVINNLTITPSTIFIE
jgi:hypothetical protein